MADLRVRRYDPADEDAVWDLHVRALSDAGAYDEEFAHRDADLRRIETEYVEPGGEFLVGERDGEIVAMGGFQPLDALGDDTVCADDPETTVVLRRMRVDPDHQRRGFGTAILAALEERARDRGFERAVLDTTPVQAAAIAFYERRGYVERRRETIEGHELIVYGKRIDATLE